MPINQLCASDIQWFPVNVPIPEEKPGAGRGSCSSMPGSGACDGISGLQGASCSAPAAQTASLSQAPSHSSTLPQQQLCASQLTSLGFIFTASHSSLSGPAFRAIDCSPQPAWPRRAVHRLPGLGVQCGQCCQVLLPARYAAWAPGPEQGTLPPGAS